MVGVRISIDVAALSTHRMLERTDNATFRSLERLSSGARINRAADDAGGLSVSEGLRSRSSGMLQAGQNTRAGIDVVRTAEAALAETTSVLHRMRDLAVQAANDGGLDDLAADAVQREFDVLSREVTRIATTTAHNGTPLLDGTYRGTFQVGAGAGETLTVLIDDNGGGLDAWRLGVAGLDLTRGAPPGSTGAAAGVVSGATAAAGGGAPVQFRVVRAISDEEGTRTAGKIMLDGDFVSPGRFAASFAGLTGSISYDGRTLDLGAIDYTGAISASDHLDAFASAVRRDLGLNGNPVDASSTELVINGDRPRNGSTIAEAQRLSPTWTAPAPPPTLPGAPPAQAGAAPDPLDVIDGALHRVGSLRARLGAVENRLEHTVARLSVSVGDTAAAYSRIRDTDMATEMTGLTRNEVLLEAGSAMLAQARQRPQSVLRLLT